MIDWTKAPKMYIAGPYSGNIKTNVRRAWHAGRAIVQIGYVPVIPHTMTAGMEDILTTEDWYAITIELLKVCDAIYMLEGWQGSRGAIEEHDFAVKMGIPVYYQGGMEPEERIK